MLLLIHCTGFCPLFVYIIIVLDGDILEKQQLVRQK